ncbi:MAG: hypothetical protein ABI459_12220, partial [Deltaproteobacteria bacterium]
FHGPVPDLPLWLSDAMLIIRPASGEALRTGPYAPRRFEDGVLMATRNRDYFKADRAHFDSVTIMASEAVTAETASQLDLIAAPTDMQIAASTMRLQTWTGPVRLTQDWAARAGLAASAVNQDHQTIRSDLLAHGESLASDQPLDGGRIAERWWRA